MKRRTTLFLIFYGLLYLYGIGQEREGKPYSYFIPEYKISDTDSRIEINKNGDTVLVSSFQIQNGTTNTHQIATKVYKNTPFFGNRWYRGQIVTDHDNALNFVMAYNIQKGVVYLVHHESEPAAIMQPIQFTIGDHTFKQFRRQYYETVYAGKSEILKEYQCVLQLAKSAQKTGYGAEEKETEFEGEFIKSVKYYLKKEKSLKNIPPGRRLFRLFGNQRKIIEAYVKEKNLKFTKEADLVAIFKYFDSFQ
ncbi:MAG: hypothetical protein R2822_13575 [Spirosomataceae bacterium]